MKPQLTLLAFLGVLAVPRALASDAPLSVEELFGSPAISQLRFSPDGRYLAALQPWERRMNLVVVDLAKMEKTQVTSMRDNNVNNYIWASNRRLICLMDEDGQERPVVFAVNVDGSAATTLDSLRGFGLVGRIAGDKENVVVQGYNDRRARPDLYHFNLRTGKARLHARNPGSFDSWVVDRAGVARLGLNFETGTMTISYRDGPKEEWRVLATFRDGEESWSPLGFDGDNQTLYVASNLGRRTYAVHRFDPRTGQLGDLVHGDDTYDVTNIIYNESLRRVVGVAYEADRPTVVWIDPMFAEHQRALDRALPDTLVRIAEASDDNSRLLVLSFSDRQPGEYFLYDTKRRSLEPLAAVKPGLAPSRLSPMHPFSFRARDGLVLHGYLTLPAGREPRNLPAIVHPHGGPFGVRDRWGYNPEVQFYASRGFAVLQVNFRGSGGYGDAFERAGYGKWGLEMQDDITDTVKWAVAQGIADPSRIVISGASYGGYAAMAGLAYTPELYCAGINYIGVTDLMMLVDDPALGSYDGRNGEWWRRTRIGDPYKDRARLRATSPANFADTIRVPLFMGYGLNDPRVEISHGTKVVARLKAGGRVEGRDFWFITERWEGHGFTKEENRIAFFHKVDAFLRDSVLGRPAGAGGAGPASSTRSPGAP